MLLAFMMKERAGIVTRMNVVPNNVIAVVYTANLLIG